jgi:hypothetical protein
LKSDMNFGDVIGVSGAKPPSGPLSLPTRYRFRTNTVPAE